MKCKYYSTWNNTAMAVSKAISTQEMISLIQSEMAYDQISSMLQNKNPTARRLSPRSICRYCQINNLGRNCKLTSKEIRTKVYQCVSEVF